MQRRQKNPQNFILNSCQDLNSFMLNNAAVNPNLRIRPKPKNSSSIKKQKILK